MSGVILNNKQYEKCECGEYTPIETLASVTLNCDALVFCPRCIKDPDLEKEVLFLVTRGATFKYNKSQWKKQENNQ